METIDKAKGINEKTQTFEPLGMPARFLQNYLRNQQSMQSALAKNKAEETSDTVAVSELK